MPNTPTSIQLGLPGWLTLLVFAIGFLIRLLKADALNAFIQRFVPTAKPLPKAVLPWLALVLGFTYGTAEAKLAGHTWGDSALMGVWGIFAGGGAVAVNETLSTLVRAFSPALADLLFGKNGGPGPGTPDPAKDKKDPPPPAAGGGGLASAVSTLCLAVLLGAVPGLFLLGCTAVLSALPTVLAVVTDGMLILDQIQAFLDAYFKAHPDPAKEKDVVQAIAKARAALLLAQRGTEGAQALNQAQIDAAFQDFRVAYQELMMLIAPFGVHSTPVATGVYRTPEGELVVPMPEAFHTAVPK